MITARSLANQKLYHARILAGSWRREIAAQSTPATVLSGAFEPACRQHLRLAYGWFLLEILQTGELPDQPPLNTEQLPEIPPGKSTPPEIQELRQLEGDGWIGDMLAAQAGVATPPRRGGNLALAVSAGIGFESLNEQALMNVVATMTTRSGNFQTLQLEDAAVHSAADKITELDRIVC